MRLLHHATDVRIRKYAEKLHKIYRDLQQNTETWRIPVGQISYSSMGGVALFNGIAHRDFWQSAVPHDCTRLYIADYRIWRDINLADWL